MQVKRHKLFESKKFRTKEISGVIISIMDELGVPDDVIEISGVFETKSGETENKKITLSDLAAIRDFEGQAKSIIVYYPTDPMKVDSKDNSISFSNDEGGILVNVCTSNFPSIQNIMKKLESQLKLVEMQEEPKRRECDEFIEGKSETKVEYMESENRSAREGDELLAEKVETKVEVNESANKSTGASLEKAKSLSCFLFYRFNSRIKYVAPELTRFLSLLDIKVLSVITPDQRRRAEKASGQPNSRYDFFMYLITVDDADTWSKEEIALVYDEGVPVIMLVEKGWKGSKDMLSGGGRIEFDADHIGDTFIAIMEVINLIKEEKFRSVTSDKKTSED